MAEGIQKMPLSTYSKIKIIVLLVIALPVLGLLSYLWFLNPAYNDLVLTDPNSYWISFGLIVVIAYIIGFLIKIGKNAYIRYSKGDKTHPILA